MQASNNQIHETDDREWCPKLDSCLISMLDAGRAHCTFACRQPQAHLQSLLINCNSAAMTTCLSCQSQAEKIKKELSTLLMSSSESFSSGLSALLHPPAFEYKHTALYLTAVTHGEDVCFTRRHRWLLPSFLLVRNERLSNGHLQADLKDDQVSGCSCDYVPPSCMYPSENNKDNRQLFVLTISILLSSINSGQRMLSVQLL